MIDKSTGRTAIVDPGDGARCLAHFKDLQLQYDEAKAARVESGGDAQSGDGGGASLDGALLGQVQNRPELTTALVTHHHLDHAGGLAALRAAVAELRVIAGQKEAVPHTNAPTTHGARMWLGATEIDVLSAPCHTRGHVLFHVHGPTAKRGGPPPPGAGARGFAGSGALFSGDTLFLAGCGRFFEGDAEDMYYVLNTVLRPLPAETPVFCGHEYAVDNLRFALWIDPGNRDVQVRGWSAPAARRGGGGRQEGRRPRTRALSQDKLAWALRARGEGLATVPSLLAEERTYNPFMRVHVPSLRAAGEASGGGGAAAALHAHAWSSPPIAVSEALRSGAAGGGGASGSSSSGEPREALAEVPALAGLRALKNAKAHLKSQPPEPPPLPLPGGGAVRGGAEGARTPYADL